MTFSHTLLFDLFLNDVQYIGIGLIISLDDGAIMSSWEGEAPHSTIDDILLWKSQEGREIQQSNTHLLYRNT